MFHHKPPDASRVVLFVAAPGVLASSFKQSSLPQGNKPAKNTSIRKE
jgi:hypothetical protein